MTFKETLSYLYESLPMYQRDGQQAFKKNLDNIFALCSLLGDPQNTFSSIHIAGTNGKGSTAHMLAACLQASGKNVGLYTSPHLKSFTERIRYNGRPIPEKEVVQFVVENKVQIEAIAPSFFEITVAMAFAYFASMNVDIAVIETGLGGRLDSTNIIHPILSVITNIGYDHQQMLGETLPEIAAEKAGIIKKGVPVVVGEKKAETEAVFTNASGKNSAPLIWAEEVYSATSVGDFTIQASHVSGSTIQFNPGLKGSYQVSNMVLVLSTIEVLQTMGYAVSEESIVQGLEEVVALTGIKGRWQILGAQPLVLCDTAHNEEGITAVLQQITKRSYHNLHIVWGMVNDKAIEKVLKLLPEEANYYFCEPKIPRAMGAESLAKIAQTVGLQGIVIEDVNLAIAEARGNAQPEDIVFIGGSTFVVAEIEEL